MIRKALGTVGLLFSWVASQGPEVKQRRSLRLLVSLLHRGSPQRKACKTEAISRSACGWGGLAVLSLVLAQPTYAPLQNGLTAGCVFFFSFSFFHAAVCTCVLVCMGIGTCVCGDTVNPPPPRVCVCGSLKLMSKSLSVDLPCSFSLRQGPSIKPRACS